VSGPINMRIETRQWLPMTQCEGYLLTHRFGSRTQLDFCGQYSDHCSTYTFSHVGILYCTHNRCETVGERMPERCKVKRSKSVMSPLNVDDDWSVWHFPQFTESWTFVRNTQDVEVYWEC